MSFPPPNECQFTAASGGVANFVVSAAVTGFFTPAQCTNPLIVDGDTYYWRAESSSLQEHELFQGTYTASTATVARTTILQSSNGGAKVNFTAAPKVRLVLPSQALRTVLTGNISIYVSTTGSDTTGNGTSALPFATLGHANTYIRNNLDFGGFRIDLILQTAGTYLGFQDGGGYVGGGILSIRGATAVPASYVVTDTGIVAGAVFRFIYDTSTNIRFDQLTFKPITNFVDCIWHDCHARMTIAGNWSDGLGQAVNLDFSSDVTNGNGWIASGGAYLAVYGAVGVTVPPTGKINTFYGSFGNDDNNIGGTYVTTFNVTTFSNNLRTNQFAFVDSFSSLIEGGDTFVFTTGSATSGKKFKAETAGIINTFGLGLNYLPGPTAGTLASGAQYL